MWLMYSTRFFICKCDGVMSYLDFLLSSTHQIYKKKKKLLVCLQPPSMSFLSLIRIFSTCGSTNYGSYGRPTCNLLVYYSYSCRCFCFFFCRIGQNLIGHSYTIFPRKLFKISPLDQEFYFLLEIETIFSVETMISVVSVVFTSISFGCCLDILEFPQQF